MGVFTARALPFGLYNGAHDLEALKWSQGFFMDLDPLGCSRSPMAEPHRIKIKRGGAAS